MAFSQENKQARRATVKATAKAGKPERAQKGRAKPRRAMKGLTRVTPLKAAAKPKAGKAVAAKVKTKPAKAVARTSKVQASKGRTPARKTTVGSAPKKSANLRAAAAQKGLPSRGALKKTSSTKAASKNGFAKAVSLTTKLARPPVRTTLPREPEPSVAELAARERVIARDLSVAAVNRALDLLETLARTGPVPLGVLADTAGCGKTAATELLATLQARNFVIQEGTHGLWRIGARWAVLSSAASDQGALAATSMPFLVALGNATGENVYLRVRDGMECETVAIYQTDPGLRVYTDVGTKMPLHAGTGRLLLAHAPEAVQTQVLARRLQRYTPSTRIDPTWIAAELHRIRQRGFLITDSEVVAGTVSVCAAVRDASGQVVATLLIGAPSLRMRPPRPRALMPAVVEAARKLSLALGWSADQQMPAPANGPIEARRQGEIGGPSWPASAMGAVAARPHSIFR